MRLLNVRRIPWGERCFPIPVAARIRFLRLQEAVGGAGAARPVRTTPGTIDDHYATVLDVARVGAVALDGGGKTRCPRC